VNILVAGVGNVLWGDDGFGVEVIQRLRNEPLPGDVRLTEIGTGGINLVQDLMDPFEALVVIDAVDHGRNPGTVMLIDPEVADVEEMAPMEKYDFLADMHYTKPERAFMLAKALGWLPEQFVLLGCQPEDVERLGTGLSEPVAAAVDVAVAEVHRLVAELQAQAS
jgi:hydrogenase maturation protease